MMDNVLKMVQVIIESIKNGTCWSHVEEFIYRCFHNGVKGLFMDTFQCNWDDIYHEVLSDAVYDGQSKYAQEYFVEIVPKVVVLRFILWVGPCGKYIIMLDLTKVTACRHHKDYYKLTPITIEGCENIDIVLKGYHDLFFVFIL